MQVPDYTNLEEAWDSYPASALSDPEGTYEVTFYAGAMSALWLISQGRSPKTLNAEMGDWLACQRERFNAKH